MKSTTLMAAMMISFASAASAGIIGSTYNYGISRTGDTTVSGSGAGTFTHPSVPSFCIGPNGDECASRGLFGSFEFTDVNPFLSRITFSFFGATDFADGSFIVSLGNFTTTDGSVVTGVSYRSGNLFRGDFSSVTWDGTTAVFTGTPNGRYSALGGSSVVFDVAVAPIPEPSTYALLGGGFVAMAALRRRFAR